MSHNTIIRISGVIVSVLASIAVGSVFEPQFP